jgi:hypothetical protein
MTTLTKSTAALAIAVGMITSLVLSAATPSLAQDAQHYQPNQNGFVGSVYPGNADRRTVQRPTYRATDYNTHAPASTNRGSSVVNDPPGADFQTQGNNDDMGCPC